MLHIELTHCIETKFGQQVATDCWLRP